MEAVLWRRVLHRRDSVTVIARRRGRLQPQRRRLGGLVAHAVAGGKAAAHGVAAKVGRGGLRSVHVVVDTVVGRNKVAGGKGEGIKIVRRISREEGRRVHSTVDFHAVRRLCDVGVPDLGSVWCGWGVVEGGGGRGGSGDEEVENDESWAGGCRCALMRPGLAASTLYRPCRGESASSPARRQINQISDIVFSNRGALPLRLQCPAGETDGPAPTPRTSVFGPCPPRGPPGLPSRPPTPHPPPGPGGTAPTPRLCPRGHRPMRQPERASGRPASCTRASHVSDAARPSTVVRGLSRQPPMHIVHYSSHHSVSAIASLFVPRRRCTQLISPSSDSVRLSGVYCPSRHRPPPRHRARKSRQSRPNRIGQFLRPHNIEIVIHIACLRVACDEVRVQQPPPTHQLRFRNRLPSLATDFACRRGS